MEVMCRYFLILLQIPDLDLRLACALHMCTHDAAVELLNRQMRCIIAACEAQLGSGELVMFCNHVLVIGNTMNQGTPKGSAQVLLYGL